MRIRPTPAAFAAGVLLLAACPGPAEKTSPCPGNAGVSKAAKPAGPAPAAPGLKTTTGSLAVRNLNSQVDGMERVWQARPRTDMAERLVEFLLSRAHFLGKVSDFRRAVEVASATARSFPADPAAWLVAAKAAAAVHRFDDALAHLAAAEKHGATAAALAHTVATRRAAIAAARGDIEGAVRLAEAALRARRTFDTLTGYAAALAEAGEYQRADGQFLEAVGLYRDVSPFPVAWLDFQRGVMWAEKADKPAYAPALYDAALARLPEYVIARVHRAELHAAAHDYKKARELLLPVVDAEDPEPPAVLAEVSAAAGDAAEAGRLTAAAAAGYTRVMAEFPEAYADHAAHFWLGAGRDAARALEAAELNLTRVRRTRAAYALAIAAALAAGNQAKACAWGREAQASPHARGAAAPGLKACGPNPATP